MERYSKIPLLFFFIAASLGLLLRWHFIVPLEFIKYPFLLHAHSHIMFLGWVFNALYFAFIFHYLKEKWNSRYRLLFILLQVLVVGMLISFPLQGYGVFSIILSTLHLAVAVVFIIRFFRDTRQHPCKESISLKSIKIALVFFLLSALGPFAVGIITSQGLGQSQWYYFAIYYYLHFQYNGFFLFGIIGLFYKFLEDRNITFSSILAKRGINLLAVACLPAYFLSVLWANPGTLFTLISFSAAILQVMALFPLLKSFLKSIAAIKFSFKSTSIVLLLIVLLSLITKAALQLISVHPSVAQLAYQFRTYVIAYLHLVLLGIISLFLLIWYIENELLKLSRCKPAFSLFLIGLIGMELLLIATPFLSSHGVDPVHIQKCVFFFSIFLWMSAGWIAFAPASDTTARPKTSYL